MSMNSEKSKKGLEGKDLITIGIETVPSFV